MFWKAKQKMYDEVVLRKKGTSNESAYNWAEFPVVCCKKVLAVITKTILENKSFLMWLIQKSKVFGI